MIASLVHTSCFGIYVLKGRSKCSESDGCVSSMAVCGSINVSGAVSKILSP
jgi:hypothetical protein